MENFAKMRAGSTARKSELVQFAVQNLRENARVATRDVEYAP